MCKMMGAVTACLCAPGIHVLTIVPTVMILGGGAFGR